MIRSSKLAGPGSWSRTARVNMTWPHRDSSFSLRGLAEVSDKTYAVLILGGLAAWWLIRK